MLPPTPSPTPTSQPRQGIIYLTTTATPSPSYAPTHKDVLSTPAGLFVALFALVVTVALLVEGYKKGAFKGNGNGWK